MTDAIPDAQIVICGRGGQGILFLTRLLDEVALSLGLNVISSETHGMAMRGGSVVSYVKIGNFNSPLIRSGQGDILFALAESELPLTRHLLKKKGGQIYVNSPETKPGAIDASAKAEALGSLVVSNLVLLGFACSHPVFPFTFESIKSVLITMSPKRVLENNIKALKAGYEAAGQAQQSRVNREDAPRNKKGASRCWSK